MWDTYSEIEGGRILGHEQGLEEGREQGRKEGLKEGLNMKSCKGLGSVKPIGTVWPFSLYSNET